MFESNDNSAENDVIVVNFAVEGTNAASYETPD